MSIYRQTVTLTIFSKSPLDPNVLTDTLTDRMHRLDAVCDVDMGKVRELTEEQGKSELHFRDFDPDVLDSYDIQTYSPA